MIEKEMKQFYEQLQLPSGLIERTIAAAKQKAERRSRTLQRVTAIAAVLAVVFLGGFTAARLTRRPPTDVIFPASTSALSAGTPSEATPSEAVGTLSETVVIPSTEVGTPSEPIVTTAFAVRPDQNTGTPFGGSYWQPEFRGHQLGMWLPAVMLNEQKTDSDFKPLTADSLYQLPENTQKVVYQWNDAEVFGEPCQITYYFRDNVLRQVTGKSWFDDSEIAEEYYRKVLAAMQECYGEIPEDTDATKELNRYCHFHEKGGSSSIKSAEQLVPYYWLWADNHEGDDKYSHVATVYFDIRLNYQINSKNNSKYYDDRFEIPKKPD